MANIVEENIVIKLSRIAKTKDLASLADAELMATIESVVQELVGEAVVVEVVVG